MKENFKILALGGIDEVGKNSYVIETEKDMLLIDAGSANFTNKSLGIDMILPDFNYIIENKNKLRGILISHGHIDQMGALNTLLDTVQVNVYASRYTIKFLRFYINKKHWPLLKEIRYAKPLQLGDLTVDAFGLSHAIFGNFGFVVSNSEKKAIVYATDYNFDQSANKFARTDIKKIVELASEYEIEALLTEAVSADKTGSAAGDKNHIRSFERVIEEAKGKTIIGLYSSNLAGMTTIIRTAEKYDKRVVIIGRDLLNYVNIAREEGYLFHKRDIFARIADLGKINPKDTIVVVSGLYSEPFTELIKMSRNKHNIIAINKEDTVLIASKAYDEIESFAQTALDSIARTECVIKQQNLNVPSHAHQEDIKLLINLFAPKFIIPIKGEFRKLNTIKNFITEIGKQKEDCYLITPGEILNVYDEYCLVDKEIILEPVLISQNNQDVNQKLIYEREILANNGYVVIEMIYFKGENTFCQEPVIISGGLINFNDDAELINSIKKIVTKESEKGFDRRELTGKIRNKVARMLQNNIGKKPHVLVSRVEINKDRIKGSKNGK